MECRREQQLGFESLAGRERGGTRRAHRLAAEGQKSAARVFEGCGDEGRAYCEEAGRVLVLGGSQTPLFPTG
eukprot:COSAG02_NODE_492_length_21210_cov_13.381176_16_plen_72_part_00